MTALDEIPDFEDFSFIELDENGRIVVRSPNAPPRSIPSVSNEFQNVFDRIIVLPDHCTDLFIWVHGWRNKESHVLSNARTLFPAISRIFKAQQQKPPPAYPLIGVGAKAFVPAFLAIHWPSDSLDYDKIRDRAKHITERGEAEYVLAKLLGYLETKNPGAGASDRKTLAARGGFFVHCLGHSFAGRVLTAAIKAAVNPTPITKTLSGHSPIPPYTVDSMLIFQMAAPAVKFAPDFKELLADTTPLRHPCVLTHSTHDTANCVWHLASENEVAIGCRGAVQPASQIHNITLHDLNTPYSRSDFSSPLVNVDASHLFKARGWAAGAHGDYWYEESVHLALSLAEHARR
ncbi:MAG: hypothetical protein ABI619_07230 [Betaproteobacteria bacterium]